MQASVKNYQKRSLEFYELRIFSIIHILYIQYLLTEFTNKNKATINTSESAMLVLTIKNAMSVVATVYAADSVAKKTRLVKYIGELANDDFIL